MAVAPIEVLPLPREQVSECVSLFCAVFNQPPWSDGWSPTAAAERLQAAGIGVVFLETRSDLPARHFYTAQGFKVAPVTVMGKSLG